MRAIRVAALAALLTPASLLSQTGYESTYDLITHLRGDPTRVAAVHNLVLTRDAARFTFTSGTLELLAPFGTRVVGVVFVGQGTFDFVPPTDVEKDQLNRFVSKRELHEPLTNAVLLFTDSTFAELSAKVTFGAGPEANDADDIASDAMDYLKSDDSKGFDVDLWRALLNSEAQPMFYAQVRAGKTFMVEIDPYEDESVRLEQPADVPRHKWADVMCAFRPHGTGAASAASQGLDRPMEPIVGHYQVESWLPRNAFASVAFSAAATIVVTAARPIGPWIPFILYDELLLDSVQTNAGAHVASWKAKDNPVAWLKLDRPLDPARVDTLRLYYHGDLIEHFGEWFFIKTSGTWYPRALGVREAATFDLTFHSPAKYALQSIGDRVDSTVTGETMNTHWTATAPMRNATFNLGKFTRHQEVIEGAPPVTVLFSEEGHRAISAALVQGSVVWPRSNMEAQVGADVGTALKFFNTVYGQGPTKEVSVSEIPFPHGEAFPGAVQLSYLTFIGQDSKGFSDLFRAHEAAHQWWGIGVDFDTYHDQWLSEGFAEFSGLWYLQAVHHDNKKYFDWLHEWKREITDSRSGLFSKGQQAGPISLGGRTSSSRTPSDYDLIIYEKGAWVLHMLRMLMIDFRTMNEDAFKSTMQDFYATYHGRRASTADFQAVVEKHIGMPMDWFFQEWVDGTAIPTYRVTTTTTRSPDNRFKVHLHVLQEGVPDTFRMYVPVTVDLGQNRQAHMRVEIKGPVTDLDLPVALPAEPVRVVFNDLDGVLADVKQ